MLRGMDLFTLVLVLIIIVFLWPTVPGAVKTIIGIIVGAIVICWLLGIDVNLPNLHIR